MYDMGQVRVTMNDIKFLIPFLGSILVQYPCMCYMHLNRSISQLNPNKKNYKNGSEVIVFNLESSTTLCNLA